MNGIACTVRARGKIEAHGPVVFALKMPKYNPKQDTFSPLLKPYNLIRYEYDYVIGFRPEQGHRGSTKWMKTHDKFIYNETKGIYQKIIQDYYWSINIIASDGVPLDVKELRELIDLYPVTIQFRKRITKQDNYGEEIIVVNMEKENINHILSYELADIEHGGNIDRLHKWITHPLTMQVKLFLRCDRIYEPFSHTHHTIYNRLCRLIREWFAMRRTRWLAIHDEIIARVAAKC